MWNLTTCTRANNYQATSSQLADMLEIKEESKSFKKLYSSKMKHSKKINTSLLILIMVSFSLLSITKVVMCNNDDDGIRGKSETPLDIAYPILISEKEASPSKSYFGYSVSLAKGKSEEEKSSQDPDGWIFIGAPKSNSSSTMYKDKGEAPLEPGVVWRCSLGRNPSVGDSCEMMNVDPASNDVRPNAPVMESHNGAWIGVTLEVNYGRLLTCGMRWNRGMLQFYNGICYWFADTESSKRASYRSNDLSKLVDRKKYDQRLTTFFRSDATQDRLFTFTNSMNESSRGHEWQISQAGMSVHLFQDNHDLENEGIDSMPSLLIGAPGVREWSGAVVLYTNTITPRPEMARPNRNQEDPTFSEFLVGNRGIIPTPETHKLNNHWNEYFGYSVTSGRYFNKTGKILYAAGAPRADHSGEVVIFDFPPYKYPSDTYKRQVDPLLEIKAPKNSFGSYFGSVLYTVDLNGDGVDELFVGAPLYTFDDTESSGKGKDGIINNPNQINPKLLEIKEKSGKSYEIGDHGSVFFFNFFNVSNSKNGTESGENYRRQGLSGSKIPRARFGSAISSIVFNLNNGTRDVYLVVGAPYEYNSDEAGSEATGAVYLYQYLSNSGNFGDYSQRIMASTISSSLNGFGSSLSIPADVDLNGTPDIAVGAYQSGHAVVFRTRPKIEINSWMVFVSNEGHDIKEVRRGSPQFYLKSCFSVAENLGLIALIVDIWVRLKFFDPSIRFAEEVVRRNPSNSGNEIIYKRTVSAHTSESCENLIVLAVHKDGIGMDDSDIIAEIAHPLHFIQEVWYNETLQQPLTVTNYYASDDAPTRRQRQTDTTAATFQSFDSRKPSPQFTKTAQDLPISLNDCMNKVCLPEIHMKWSFFNEKNESIDTFLLGLSKEIRVEILISNTGESAIQPWLTLDWSLTHIRETTSGTPWLNRTCVDQSHSDTKIKNFRCPLGRYIKKGRSINIVIHFNMEDFFVSEPNNIKFIVNGAVRFQEMRNDPVITQGILSLYVPKTEVVFRGSMRNVTLRTPLEYSTTVDKENLNKGKKDKKLLFASFRHEFSVEVLGASVQKLQARFQLPVALNADSGPLFLIKRPYILSTNGKAFQNPKCELVPSRYYFHEVTFTNVPLSPGAFSAEGGDGHSLSFHEKFLLPEEFARRWKREANRKNVAVPIGMDTPVTPSSRKSVKETPMQVSDDTTVILRCGEANCLEVECAVDNVRAHNFIHVAFEIYPIAENIEKLLKSQEKSSILVEATGSGQIFNGRADALHEDNDVSQRMLVKISNKQVDTWVYIVATLGGILLLVLIILGLYKCGFFKREKLQQLNQMKAEHHRKSMVAAARASILQVAGGGDDGQSQEVLTEAEHVNEDTELQEKSGGGGCGSSTTG